MVQDKQGYDKKEASKEYKKRKGIIRTVVATMESSTELRKQDKEKQ
jgi:hypothetical protein